MTPHYSDAFVVQSDRSKEENLPPSVKELMEQIGSEHFEGPALVFTSTQTIEKPQISSNENTPRLIISLTRLNDVRYVNKYLESANRALPEGGYFIGCVETAYQRKESIMRRFPKPLNKIIYIFDFLRKRIAPKLPYFRKVHFAITKGQNRVISEMETYGRLYACGFKLIDTADSPEGKMFFAVEKIGDPDYNMEATYGPLIKLRRVSKGGKIIKVYKFRTMAPYSEYIQAFIFERNGYNGGSKFRDDRRVTTLGALMRRYWIDELPMLYNWLRGDLKLVGVRPVSIHYFNLFPEDFREFRKKFKPGLIPPVYAVIPNSFEDIAAIERQYLESYEKQPLLTDMRYMYSALYNILIKRIRSR